MPPKAIKVTHTFAGGWATDFGPSFYGSPTQDGKLPVPFLTEAKNVIYEFDGGPHKCPGTAKFNGSTLGASTAVIGIYDYWRNGTGGSATQRILGQAGTAVYQDQGTQTFTSLFTGLTSGSVPSFSTFDDLLIYANDSTVDVPKSWDGTTAQSLAGTPPRFSFSAYHRNRQFAAGDYAAPSRLYYSVDLNPEDWAGSGSGSIDIDPNDGDMIVGIASFNNDMFVFKGPHKLSIHRITGSSPSGSDAYARLPFIQGISAAWHNSIFKYGNDLGFISPWGTVHSLRATQNYGSFNQAFLSFPIGSYVRDSLNHNPHRKWWAVNHPQNGYALISVSGSGQSNNNQVLMMDYRFMTQGEQYPRWALWDSFSFASLAQVIDTNNRPRMFGAGYTGYVWKMDQASRSHDGTAINDSVKLPFLTYGDEWMMKTLTGISIGVQPKNGNNITVGWTRDNNTQQTATVSQAGGDVLG